MNLKCFVNEFVFTCTLRGEKGTFMGVTFNLCSRWTWRRL